MCAYDAMTIVMGGWEKVLDQTKGFCLLNISQTTISTITPLCKRLGYLSQNCHTSLSPSYNCIYKGKEVKQFMVLMILLCLLLFTLFFYFISLLHIFPIMITLPIFFIHSFIIFLYLYHKRGRRWFH